MTEIVESLTIAFLISSEVAPQRSAVRIANEMPSCCNLPRSWTSTNVRLNLEPIDAMKLVSVRGEKGWVCFIW